MVRLLAVSYTHLGVEDGDDTSYEDILFCIDANPNEAIQDPDRPVIDPVSYTHLATQAHAGSAFGKGCVYRQGGLDECGRPADTRTPFQRHSLRVLVLLLLKDYPCLLYTSRCV